MAKKSRIMEIAINVLLWIVIIVAALFTIVTLATKDEAGVSSIGGYMPMMVLSDSMVPEFSAGDLILVKEISEDTSLEVGDVVSFYAVIEGKTALNTHRIVEIIDSAGLTQYVTKGDANELIDEKLITNSDIVGKYTGRVPVVGKLVKVLSSKIGFLLIIVLPLLLFFLFQLYKLILLLVEMKKQAVIEATEQSRAALEAEIREKLEREAKEKEQEQEQATEAVEE